MSSRPYNAIHTIFPAETSEPALVREHWIVSDRAAVLKHVVPIVPILPSDFDQFLYQMVLQNESLAQLLHLGFASGVRIGGFISAAHAGLFRLVLPPIVFGADLTGKRF